MKADEYSVIYYTGGHGVMYDFAENQALQELARKIYEKKVALSQQSVTALSAC